MTATTSKLNVSQYEAKINIAYAIAMQQHMHNLFWRKYSLTLRKMTLMTQGKSYPFPTNFCSIKPIFHSHISPSLAKNFDTEKSY